MRPIRSGSALRTGQQQRDRWTTSYADFVTILLTLFVAIAAQAMQTMPAAPRLPVEQVRPKPPERPPAIVSAFQKLERDGIKLHAESRGLVLTLDQKILFGSGDDRIHRDAYPVVSEIAKVLDTIPNKVSLIGHSDSRPITSKRFRDNWELSVARSLRLREVLTGEFGIDESRVSVASMGATMPLSSDNTEDGRAANRRVEILILDEQPSSLSERGFRSQQGADRPVFNKPSPISGRR